jgi:hypothetical protein
MPEYHDGPFSNLFEPLSFPGNATLETLAEHGVSPEMVAAREHAPSGSCVGWGIPFQADKILLISGEPVSVEIEPVTARWLVFMHTADRQLPERNKDGFISPMRGNGHLGEIVATYILCYADGSEEQVSIRGRYQLGPFQRNWGENCFQAVPFQKSFPVAAMHEQFQANWWGLTQTRVSFGDRDHWTSWLWAWENPHPEKPVTGFRFEPGSIPVLLSAISAGNTTSLPLRWQSRAKACLKLPPGEAFKPELNAQGLLTQVQLDLGQVISARPRLLYPSENWGDTYNNQIPPVSQDEILIEYAAHPGASFHLSGGNLVPVTQVEQHAAEIPLQAVPLASTMVKLRVLERGGGSRPVPVKLHIHGEWGEYLAPVDRPRILNPAWFEDYSPDVYHYDG